MQPEGIVSARRAVWGVGAALAPLALPALALVALALAALALAALALGGCGGYRPDPLDPARTLEEVAQAREEPDPAGTPDVPFTFSRAAAWMREHGPEVRDLEAAYRTARALSEIPTPWPNPVLEAGLLRGAGSDLGSARGTVPFGSLGIAIPVTGRRTLQDTLHRAETEVARVEAASRLTELTLELRRAYARWGAARMRLGLLEPAAAEANLHAEAAGRLLDAGLIGAGEAGRLSVSAAQARADAADAADREARQEGDLSRLVGVAASRFRPLPETLLPPLPAEIPGRGALRDFLVNRHPALGRLRARYEQAEVELRLEYARRRPGVTLRPSGSGDPGERKSILGLSIGIEIPIFDRNQQGIAEALGRREEIRTRYETALNLALADLEEAGARLAPLADARAAAGEASATAERNLARAESGIEAGILGAAERFEATREARYVRAVALDARLAEILGWIDLEAAVGGPIVRFPGEETEER